MPGYAKTLFKYLKHGKKLRGTKFDPLGYSYERKLERSIRDHYISLVKEWSDNINLDNYSSIVELATQPENIRGYGHIKIESIKKSLLFKDLL